MVAAIPDPAGAAAPRFSLTFWGVRGSLAVPGPATARYGGNTPCLEVMCGGRRLILDAGTGIRALGRARMRALRGAPIDIFLTHVHHDHVGGLPFFEPLYVDGVEIRIWAPRVWSPRTIEEILAALMADPLHPVQLGDVAATVRFMDFTVGERLELDHAIALTTITLNHPNRAVAYRIDYDGRSLCYVTDTEHFPDRLDDGILGLIAGADMVVYDAMWLPEEYESYRGWGHSTWRAGLALVEAAGAGRLVLFHHAPERADVELDRLAVEAETARPGTRVAMEGMVLWPGAAPGL